MAIANLTAKRGDSLIITLTTTLLGNPYNLNGHLIWFTAKANEDDVDGNAVIKKDNLIGGAGGIVVNVSPNNTATITLDPIDTISIPTKSLLHYDVQIKSSSNVVTTVAEGIIRVSTDTTRSY